MAKWFAVFAIALSFSTSLAFGQDSPKIHQAFDDEGGTAVNATTGARKLGYFLEGEFSKYFVKCAGRQMRTKDGAPPLTSIPQPILGSIDPYTWVRRPYVMTVANGFSIVVDGTNLAKADLPNYLPDASRFPFDGLQDPSTMVPAGVSGFAYSANCSAIFAAAATAETKINFTVAELSGMIKADYNSDSSAELGLVSGQFNSPFRTLYSGADSPTDARTFAHFLLWAWYRNHYSGVSSIPDEKLASLSWFKGFALYYVSKSKRTVDDKISVSGNASASFLALATLKASGQLDQSYSNYGFADLKTYEFAILDPQNTTDPNQATYQFELLEKPSIVASWLSTNAVGSLYSGPNSQGTTPSLKKKQAIAHKQQVVGMPQSLCERNYWKPIPQPSMQGLGSLDITDREFKTPSNLTLPSCVFEISYTPDDSLFSGKGVHSALLDYTLENAIGDQKIEIKMQKVQYQTSDLPKLSSQQAYPYPFDPPETKVNGVVLSWKVAVQAFEAPDAPLDFSTKPQSLGDIAISGCKTLANARDPIITTIVPTDNQSQLTITQFIQGQGSYKPDAPDNVTCGLTGTLQYHTKSGSYVSLTLPKNLVITYPNPEGKGFAPGTLLKVSPQ